MFFPRFLFVFSLSIVTEQLRNLSYGDYSWEWRFFELSGLEYAVMGGALFMGIWCQGIINAYSCLGPKKCHHQD